MTLTFTETFHQALSIITVSLNELHYGIGDGWIAPTLVRLQNPNADLHFTVEDASWIASIEHIGSIFGCLIPVFLVDVLGRKTVISGCAIVYFFVWLGVALSYSVPLVICMRLLFGIASGANNSVSTLYLAEVTSPSVRGIFSALVISLYYFGMLAEYTAATYLPYRVTAIANACLGLVSILSVHWMLESPHFLILDGKPAQAKRNYMRLRGVRDFTLVRQHFQHICENVEFESTLRKMPYYKLLFTLANRKSILIVLGLHALCDATGYTVVLSYASTIFTSTSILTENEFTILLGLVQFAASFFAFPLMIRYGRRSLLLTTFSLITVAQLCTAALYYVNECVTSVPYFSWLIFVTVTVYIGVMALGYPAIYALRGELLPLSVKAIGGCAEILCNSIVNFVINITFLHISRCYGAYVNFLIYSAAGLVFIVFLHLYLPETRNKTLIEIQDELHGRNGGV